MNITKSYTANGSPAKTYSYRKIQYDIDYIDVITYILIDTAILPTYRRIKDIDIVKIYKNKALLRHSKSFQSETFVDIYRKNFNKQKP